jgi:Multicopper oxidase
VTGTKGNPVNSMNSPQEWTPAVPAAEAAGGRFRLDRRNLFRAGAGVAAIGGMAWAGKVLEPQATAGTGDEPDMFIGGTDGWIHLPTSPGIPPFHPDDLAPPGLTTYIFGFRNLTGMDKDIGGNPVDDAVWLNQKNKAQHMAPLFWVDQWDGVGAGFFVKLTNLGLALRPDLFDAHTLHWHGFRNVIPFFDGEPSGSISVPSGRFFTYAYRPRDPGTYMYHCHVEDVEHVHMGMTGLVFVRPLQDGNTSHYPSGKYLYNDGDGSTGYDREFAMFLSEVWAEAHWADAHIQLPEWSDYRADFSLLNGRVYPDTIAPNGSDVNFQAPLSDRVNLGVAPGHPEYANLVAPSGHPALQYQPYSSLVRCVEGERVALRFSNLGFREVAMTSPGITMRVVGRDATPLTGRYHDHDGSYRTNTLNIGPGESYDVILEIPDHSTGTGTTPDKYLLYNRAYQRSNNRAAGGMGGAATEIHVYADGHLSQQQFPNDWAEVS